MSEGIIIALITAAGSLIGAIIASSISARAVIDAARVEVGQIPLKEQKSYQPLWILGGAIIGAVLVLAALTFSGILPINLFADPTIYDNFNKSAFDGKINTSLWSPVVASPNYIKQENGVLVLSIEPNGAKTTSLFATKKLKSNQNNFAESKMFLSNEKTGQDGDIGFALMTTDKKGQNLIFLCVISRFPPIQTWCEVYGRNDDSGPEYLTEKTITSYDVWHTVRIEMDPEINATFYIDGQKVGSYRPNDAEELKGKDFTVRLEIWSPMQDGIKAHFDDVRLGQFQ